MISNIIEIRVKSVFFFLSCFFVSSALKRDIARTTISINMRSVKIVFTTPAIKLLISFRLIQRELKNFTSSTV